VEHSASARYEMSFASAKTILKAEFPQNLLKSIVPEKKNGSRVPRDNALLLQSLLTYISADTSINLS